MEHNPLNKNNPSRREFIKTIPAMVGMVKGFNENEQNSNGAENQFKYENGDCEFVFSSNDPGKAHESANTFADEVGKLLKREYPSRILNPRLKLEVSGAGTKKNYRIRWNCKILKTTPENADYYFDRRGTLLSGKTLNEAKQKVEAELARSQKVEIMRKGFKHPNIPPSFIQDSFSGSENEGYWYIKEIFMVASK